MSATTTHSLALLIYITSFDQQDVKKAAHTLLEAFAEDSLAKMLVCHIKDARERKICELTLYEAYLRQHIDKGIVIGQGETEAGFETVSIWSHPESEQNGLDSYNTLMEAGYGKVWNLYGEEGRRKVFYGMLPLLHELCERIVSHDSRFRNKGIYTLVYVGSNKLAQGKGNVRKLFDYMFKNYIDKGDNNIAYLESSSPVNIPIYNKFGFHVVEDIMLGLNFDGAVEGQDYAVMHVMIRDSHGHDWTQDENTLGSKL
ncbi:hypothetical protein Cantr_06786 [Candida viswanathii]|uniref:N-acetyltransferase domain-containing protein n=1 Tax=Candida viswanathii TaxID=5486 RepID=A0A367XWX9_9ASCO|nr:hypothetical protein Cantr_06786 [Candida viswanathii]